ncbi:decaprenyl-phosphate phosphoribosyltransferase [candidate division WWE3 bacterium CG08_land_8_20_14_0_20_43_13]|uniref:Decaprenyl-phosphate phosphoribosyltransferase n=1 Tax=candidate division WWE3 bacterium CG08_land_8_20_14_0_20_43_13 TaxID=1975087 RepID=A0A2H0X7F0_UNCKA|nr:MAG: decaprenyl-phosphate phosphoribosyltransferase [candidate division WWE3 bacterium CG08_land_8_20_14_0_20_43_13]
MMQTMIVSKIKSLIAALRPYQWLKNVSLYVAIFFGGEINNLHRLSQVSKGFLIFCMASSAMYLINDVIDAPKDRQHPIKKRRPVASGQITPQTAIVAAILLLAVSLKTSYKLDPSFFLGVLAYFILMLLYNLFLKSISIIDALTVAAGFVVRVFAGALVSNVSISSLLVLTTIFGALFISFGKRRAEITSLEGTDPSLHRKTLKQYPVILIDKYLTISFGSAFLTYSIYTFNYETTKAGGYVATFLPKMFAQPNWLMLTIPIVFYGMSRYMYLIYAKNEGEAPEKIIATDLPLIITGVLWSFFTYLTIYFLS